MLSEPAPPELSFSVHDATAIEHAAVPTLAFALRVAASGAAVRSIVLRADIRIALARRPHDVPTRERLIELFGVPSQWRSAPRSLPWATATVVVPAFEGETIVAVPVVCTYDFEVTASKYFHALEGGDVPLEFLFTGTLFYAGADDRLQTARVPWDREAVFAMPVVVWKDLMRRYFADSVWLRLRKETFDRVWAYRARHALPTWEDALDALLRESEEPSTWTR